MPEPHEVPLHQVIGEAIQNRLRDFRVEENLQIYYPPPKPVHPEPEPDVPEQASTGGSSVSDPVRPESLPDPQSAPVPLTQSAQPPKDDVSVRSGVTEAELREMADRTWKPPAAPDTPQKASVGSSPPESGRPQTAILADGGAVREVDTQSFSQTSDVAHAEIWSPPVRDVEVATGPPAGVTAERAVHPLESTTAADVESPSGIGGGGIAGSDPTAIPEATDWLDRLKSDVTSKLVDAAVPLVTEAVEHQLAAFTDMVDEKIHELDQRFML